MRFVVILHILAAIFLTAAITHCLTREALAGRMNRVSKVLMDEVGGESAERQTKWLEIVPLHTGMPCYLSIALAVPGLTFLYGAASSHWLLRRRAPLSIKGKCGEMAGVFFILLILVALGLPC